MVDVGRRKFMSGAGFAAAGVAVTSIAPTPAKAAPAAARVDYPVNRLANIGDLKPNEPLNVSYPDDSAPGVLLKLGKKVPGGGGADGDVVGFSTTCPHKGFPLSYNAGDRTMNCPATLPLRLRSRGQQIWGQAIPAVRTARRRRATSTLKASTVALRPTVQRTLRGGATASKRQIDRL
jgi:arsenite oxidase small subunit